MGAGVSDFGVGDRVCYGTGPLGAYSQVRIAPAEKLLKIPDGIDDIQAAAMMLQGMTVQYLIRRTFRVDSGTTVLFHAAAGGVGIIACQWLKQLGAIVIGTVGDAEKADRAKAHGCDHTIIYSKENFADRVRDITGGKGVDVVYDGVGKTTIEGSLNCLAGRGMLVLFGNSSGMVPPIDPITLSHKGALYLTRPTLAHYTATRDELVETASDLFAVVGSGAVKIEARQTCALKDAKDAHRNLEARKTTGSTVMLP